MELTSILVKRRWDSSDPDRAPPPLPMNPGSTSPATRGNVSPNIQERAAGLTEKMRENAPSPYTTNPMPLKSSPEKSLIKGQYHKRLQSFQNGSDTRSEFRSFLETRSPERPLRASIFETGDKSRTSIFETGDKSKTSSFETGDKSRGSVLETGDKSRGSSLETGDKSQDKSPGRAGTSTSNGKDLGRETPAFRPSSRYLSKPILGESTPPSATMLALQNMQVPGENEPPHSNSSCSSSSTGTIPCHNFDALSSQILSLTSIATNLQREMAQLSRRSKDNATDLISLKAATNARDEDIRRSLRELAANINSKLLDPDAATRSAPYVLMAIEHIIDNIPYDSSPGSRKSYSIPRMSSANSFAAAIERELGSSPGPISDGSASIALLEKVLREMATKEGQEKLLELVNEIKSRPTKNGADNEADKTITKMLEEILSLIKEDSGSRALVRSKPDGGSGIQPNPDNPRSERLAHIKQAEIQKSEPESRSDKGTTKATSPEQASSFITEEMLDILRRVKNSVVEGGGLTNEVKALVRELRGEVLGMGREIARKLEAAELARAAEENKPRAPGREEISAIVESGLAELKEHMAFIIRENRRQSPSSALIRPTVDTAEVYTAVKNALSEQLRAPEAPRSGIEKEEILEAVKEAWETYKPEIELQNFGLEREEILECLTEGLKAYQPRYEQGVTYEQVLAAVQEGLQKFTPPPVHCQANITRDEIIVTIRECLESLEFLAPQPSDERQPGITRDEILSAISEGIASQNALTREALDAGITREEIIKAVTEGLAAHHAAAKEREGSNVTRDDVVNAINEAFSAQQLSVTRYVQPSQPSLSREDILKAIAEGLANQSAMMREREVNKDDILEVVVSGLHEATASMNTSVGEQILERLQDLLEEVKSEVKQCSASNARDTEHVLETIKDGLEDLRSEVESYVDRASDVASKDEIISTVKEGFRLLQADMERTINEAAARSAVGRGNPDTPELLDAMEKEFEHLRQTLSSLLIRNSVSSDKDEILDAIRDITESQKPNTNADMIKTVKEEFESLRETIAMSMVRSGSSTDKDEIIAALKDSFNALQEETSQKKEAKESMLPSTRELLEAFNDGVDMIRSDLENILNRPSDDSSTEILKTLREGLTSIKAEMEALREAQKELEEMSESRGKELILANENSIGNDIESLKVLITQLQIKVEAMESNPRFTEPPENALTKAHLDDLLAAVKEVQGSVVAAGARGMPVDETLAKKEDTDAIETLVRNTKAKIDELVFPGPDDMVKPEQIEALEALLKETMETISQLSTRMETEGATKTEIGTLETLMKDIWVAVDELKSKEKSAEEDPERVVKADLQTVEAMIFEVKTQLEELKLPDTETLPTKTEIKQLSDLVSEFKEKMEAEAELTAQAFEARKVEHGGLAEKIEDARSAVGELREELLSKLDGSNEGLSELKHLLDGLSASAETFSTVEDIKELGNLIRREFERARSDHEATKLETEERDAAVIVKQEETRAAIVSELGTKIDEKLSEVMAKYEEARTALESKFTDMEEREMANFEAVTNAKSVADDIKLIIGAMGNSVNEACERMSDDARTLFQKVDESYTKMEEMHNEMKSHQKHAQAEIEKTSATTQRVETELREVHPQILNSIKNILMIVSQHYEHSQRAAQEFKMNLSALPAAITPLLPALPPPEPQAPEKYDDSQVQEKLNALLDHAAKNKYDDSQIQAKLNTLLDHAANKYDDSHVQEKLDALLDHATNNKYDDSKVQDKLNSLLEHAANTSKSMSQIDRLEEIHQQMMATSREVSEMVAAQTRLMELDHERKKREAEEAAILLERRLAEKEKIEAEIMGLKEEKDSLLNMIQALKLEKEDLARQNKRLAKEVSSLETALEIRQEEMQLMEERAESLEKRILEGVLDHARSVLLSRPNMNLKRVPSSASTATKASKAGAANAAKDSHSILSSSVGLALKRRGLAKAPSTGSTVSSNASKERRILSLSLVTGNKGSTDRQTTPAPAVSSGIGSLKRSHSVRSNCSYRKRSWGARSSVANKENEVFPEDDEHGSGEESDTGTERRTSYARTYVDSLLDAAECALFADRKTGDIALVAAHPQSSLGENEDGEQQEDRDAGPHHDDDTHTPRAKGAGGDQHKAQEVPDGENQGLEPPPKMEDLVLHDGHHSDSGIGTDIPSGESVIA